MSAIEFIGFIISFIAFIFLMFKRVIEERRQMKNPYYEEEEEELQPIPPPVKRSQKKAKKEKKAEVYKLDVAPSYETHLRDVTTKGGKILKKLPSRASMLVIHEIFGPPKGFQ